MRSRKVVRIPTEWYKLLPSQSLAFWVRVAARAKKRGIAKSNLEAIRLLAQAMAREPTKRIRRKDKI